MSRSSNTTGTGDRHPAAVDAALEGALAAHGIPAPQVRKLARLAAAPLGGRPSPSDACVLIDSAGINPLSPRERSALETVANATQAEPVLVLAAGGDPAGAVEAAHVFRDIGCQRFVVTRLDIVQRLGSVLAVPEALGIAFAEGLSAAAPGRGVESFTAESLAARLLRRPEPSR